MRCICRASDKLRRVLFVRGKNGREREIVETGFFDEGQTGGPAQERDITRARIANETGGLRFGVNRIEMQRPKALILDDTYISPVPGSRRPCMVRAVSHRAVAVSHRQTSAAHRESRRPYRHIRTAR